MCIYFFKKQAMFEISFNLTIHLYIFFMFIYIFFVNSFRFTVCWIHLRCPWFRRRYRSWMKQYTAPVRGHRWADHVINLTPMTTLCMASKQKKVSSVNMILQLFLNVENIQNVQIIKRGKQQCLKIILHAIFHCSRKYKKS